LFASGDSGSPPQTKLPETVQAVVETRIASLESGLRPLLYAAAILGPPAPGFWIANLLETTSEALEPGLSRLVRKGFLTDDDDGFSFRHMLLHDTAYAMIAEQDRTRLHADAAMFLEALDEPVRPEILAMHFQEAGNAERAIHYWVKASNEALSRSSGQAAITFARKGLALIEHASDKKTSHETNLQLSLATGLMTQRGYGAEGVGQAYSRAYELSLELGAPKARTRALLGLWVHNWVAGSLDDSIAQGKELLELANQAGDPGLRLQGHGGLGSVLMHKGQHKAALEQLLAGVECMPPGKPDKITTQNAAVTCISYAAWVHALQGKTIELHRFAEQSEKISRDIENPFARAIHASLCADAFMCAGEIALCQELADTAVQVSRSNGYPFWLGSGLVLKGWALGQLGQVEQGLSAIEEGIAIFNATQARIQLPNWFGLQAETLLVAGKLEESLAAVDAAFQCAGRTGDVWFLPRVHLIAAHVHQRLGNADDFSRHNNELKIHVKRQELAPSFATLSAL
jgi:tetratricopeptide (TPR) repeat protein